MHKEDALKRYKAIISYIDQSFDETMEIYAVSFSEAESVCEEIKRKNRDLVERASRLNVFISKRIKEIRLSPDHV
jgi:hypothetical protein